VIREVYEELGLLLLKNGVKIDPDPNPNISVFEDHNFHFNDFNWEGLLLSGFKETPEYTLINPIFKTQFFLYELNNSISIRLSQDNPEYDVIEWKTPRDWVDQFELQLVQIPPPVLSLIRSLLTNKTVLIAAFSLEQKNNQPIGLQTEIELHPGIFPLPLLSLTIKPATSTNCVIIGDKENRYVIDPGSHVESENKRLVKVINGIIGKDELQGVILTHHHIDHWSSIPYMDKHLPYFLQIYAHEKTQNLIRSDEIKIDKIIKDRQIFDLGFDNKNKEWMLESQYTGGHAQDHFVFLDKRFNALISGDFVAGVGTVLIQDMGQYFRSLDMLLNQKIGMIIPAHGPVHYKGHDLLEQYKRHRLARLDFIIKAFNFHKNQATVEQLTEQAYKDVNKEYHQFAQLQVETYLRYLIEENKVEKNENQFVLLDSTF